MSAKQIGDKIYASDAISGWKYYQNSQSILHKVIENGDIKSAIYYGQKEDLVDQETCFGITPLFMMLQYSIIANFTEAIKNLVNKKIENNTSFESFLKNIEMSKHYGDAYVSKLLNYLKNAIGEEKYNKIITP